MNAHEDLLAFLDKDEVIEKIVFGKYGWNWQDEGFVPPEMQGVLLSEEEAKPLMDGWSFYGGYGAPDCYAVNVRTNQRVIWVTQYDGSTRLNGAPRNPTTHFPDMPGG